MATTRVFAIVADTDVVATIVVPDTSPNHELLWAGLSSNAVVIEATETPGVAMGWVYNGETFSAPEV